MANADSHHPVCNSVTQVALAELSNKKRAPLVGASREVFAVAYRDWEVNSCERKVAPGRSGARLLLRYDWRRLGLTPAVITTRPSRQRARGQASVGFRRLQHELNALHIMAALIRWGVPRYWALALARRWERVFHGWLYTTEP